MKSLYESLLDKDFDVTEEAAVRSALANSISKSTSEKKGKEIKVNVTEVGDKYDIKPAQGRYLCIDLNDFIEIMKMSSIKRVVFHSDYDTQFNVLKPTTIEGLDISAPMMSFELSGDLTFKNCTLRNEDGQDIYIAGDNRGRRVTVINTIIYATSFELNHCDLQMKGKSQINLEYEFFVYNLTPNQKKWMERQNIPSNDYEINNKNPNMWTNPYDIIGGGDDGGIKYFVIQDKKYTYRFYAEYEETDTGIVQIITLNNGWSLVICKKESS